MRLLLSSWFLRPGRRPEVLPPAAGGRVGVVLNALDGFGATRDRDLARELDTWKAFGYRGEEVDLRDYFTTPAALPARLATLDAIWALGGNSFVLARAMTQAGFGAAVRQQLRRPAFVYGGYSAGACVAGPDLRGIDLIDDPDTLPEGYPPDAEPGCLGLVPFRIVPHWRSDHVEAPGAELAAAHLEAAGLSHKRISDGQTIQVRGSEVTVG